MVCVRACFSCEVEQFSGGVCNRGFGDHARRHATGIETLLKVMVPQGEGGEAVWRRSCWVVPNRFQADEVLIGDAKCRQQSIASFEPVPFGAPKITASRHPVLGISNVSLLMFVICQTYSNSRLPATQQSGIQREPALFFHQRTLQRPKA